MNEDLSRQLERIFLLKNECGDGTPVSSALQDIFNLALNIPDAEIGYFSDTLFNEDNGLLKFMKVSVGSNELENAKADILHFLSEFCSTNKLVKSYIKRIKETSMTLYACDTSVKVKAEVIHVIVKILLLPDIDQLVDDLDIQALISKFWAECLKSAKYSSTLRGELYNLMGLFAKIFPELMANISDRLLSLYLSFLKQEMETSKKKKPELLVIAGCLNGLSGYLIHFTQSCVEGSKYAVEIMKYVKTCILLSDYNRYDVPKAALNLLGLHSSQFNELLTQHAEQIYDALELWINHQNKEVKKVAITAMESFLLEVSSYISFVNNEQNTKVLRNFMVRFHRTLNSTSVSLKGVLLAIKGYGKFSQAFSKILMENDMISIFDEILKRSEMALSDIETFHQLPTYLEALASMLKYLKGVTSSFLHPVEKIIVFIFDNIPKLGKTGLALYMKGVTLFIDSLSFNHSLLNTALSRIVYQCLIRTCSYATISEETTGENFNRKEVAVTYKTFLPIWKYLLEEKNYFVATSSSLDMCAKLKEMVYDSIMSAFFNVFDKLNLLTENKQEPEKLADEDPSISSDPTINLVPKMPNDFVILLNLVDLFGELLCKNSLHSFSRWVYIVVKETVKFSVKFPFISAFYKLLKHSAWILEEIGYFETKEQNDEQTGVFLMLLTFVKEVTALVKQFKDDLLVSGISLILSLPASIIKQSAKHIVPVFQVALKLGLSHYEVADLCLDTLERLNRQLKDSDMETILTAVLPYLDDYIQTFNKEAEDNFTEQVTLTKSEKKVKRIPVRYLKALAMLRKESVESPLLNLKLRTVKFLGCLGGKSSIAILKSNNDLSKAIVWDTIEHLSFAIPFRDMKPTIYLDKFLPRVVELALYSSSRQVKVISCELLHALVLFMLGKEAQQQGDMALKMSMKRLYKEIFPALIKLSCSQEQVSEQLFSPLLFQIIHWFTGKAKYKSPETVVLLEALLDGVSDSEDSVIRDFSAKCVKEFLIWSIKQSTPKQMELNPGNPKKLFKQMLSLSSHPNPFKRIAAAIIFNNCYTVFREEESLVNTFMLEMLLVFVNGLSLSHKDERSLRSIDQYELSLQHMEKIVKKKSDILLKAFKNRRRPMEFKDILDFNLSHVNDWLLQQCGAPQTACRHQCMKLACSFMTLQKGIESIEKYIMNALRDIGVGELSKKFESGGFSNKGIQQYPTLTERLKSSFSINNIVNWLENLLGALDCYCWIISAHYLNSKKIFIENPLSKLIPAIIYFINELSLLSCQSMLKRFSQDVLVSPSECNSYDRLKCAIIVRIVNVLSLTLQDELWKADEMKDLGDRVFSENLLKVIVYCIIHPQFLSFQVSDLEVLEKLPNEIYEFAVIMVKHAPEHILKLFNNVLSSVLCEKQYNLLSHLPIDISNTNSDMCSSLSQLASGYKLLHKCELFSHLSIQELADFQQKLLSSLLDSLNSMEKSFLLPAQKLLGDNLFRLYLEINSSVATFSDLFSDIESSQDLASRGLALYDLFRPIIVSYYMDHSISLTSILDKSESFNYIQLVIIQDILVEFMSQKKIYNKSAQQLAFQLLKNSEKFISKMRMERTLQMQILDIFIEILTLYEGELHELPFLNVFVQVLIDPTNSLAVKEKIICCSPQIFKNGSNQQCSDFKEALLHVVANDFPVNSDDLQIGSLKYAEYMSCLSKFLRALIISSNPTLFEILVSVFLREAKCVYEKTILPAFLIFIKNLKSNDVKIVSEFCVKMFNDELKYADDLRAGIIDRVCIPLLNGITWINLQSFFQRNIAMLTSHINEKFNKSLQSKFASQLINKICCFDLLSLMYELLGKEELCSATSTIVQAFYPNPSSGKELTVFLSKAASQSYKELYTENNVELQRKYHCSAYNCLISIISCTQNEMKFFAGLLFLENPMKGSFVLENLVDLKKEYKFDNYIPFTRKKILQLIRKASCTSQPQPEKNNFSYNSSQYLIESSLSQDVLQFDFNMPFNASAGYDIKDKSSTNEEESVKEESVEGTIELDDLNQHECMSKILSLIIHMKNKKIYMDPNDEVEANEMPAWMIYFHSKMTNKDTEPNVLLYIAKIIINEPKIFQPYGKFWFLPIIELILSQRIPGEPLNYFVIDLIATMLIWAPCIPENTVASCNLATSLLDYLMKNCHSLENSKLKNHLHIIKTISASWKDRLDCSYKLIHSLFSFSDISKKENVTGLQILGSVLANGFSPFKAQSGLSEYDYFADLCKNLVFTYKEVYATCAEVCGLSLKYYSHDLAKIELLFKMVKEHLREFSKKNKDRFVICLHKIHLNYPMIVDSFIPQLLYCTSNLFGLLKTLCIQCLASRIEELASEQQNIYSQLKGKEIDFIVNNNDEETLAAGLKLIGGLLKSLPIQEVSLLLPKVALLQTNSSIQIREIVYKSFMWCFDYFRECNKGIEAEERNSILQTCKEVLLVGINDSNTDLSLSVLNFWRSEFRLPENSVERLIEVLRALYSNKMEKEYISYSTNLMLQLTSLSPDYSLPLFSIGLDTDKNFQNFKVNFSWQRQNASLTPLFVSSQRSSTAGTYILTQSSQDERIRATQNKFEFSQTHQVPSSLDWMSPTIQVTSEPFLQGLQVSDIPTNSKILGQENIFKKPSAESLRFRHKNNKERNFHFASMEMKRQKLRESAIEQRKIARDRKVVMYRKYRVGELPDIMIKHSDLIVPLQALAQLDHKVGQLLFTSIFSAVLSQLPQNFSEEVVSKVISEVQNALSLMMQSSTYYDPTFINAIQNLCFESKEINLDPQVVSSASIISLQQPIGILLLEKQLINLENVVSEPKRKRARADLKFENIMIWSELAKIYNSIKDYDFLRSIFSSQISTNDVMKHALAAEATNDYGSALQIYREAAQKENWEDSPSYEEEEYWDTARLQCYENLGMWTNLKDFTVRSIEQINENEEFDFMKMWENDILQEVYLPCYIKSNIKLMAQGNFGAVHKEFQTFIDASLLNEYSKDHLQMRYCEDLALLKILQDNYGAAHHFLKIAENSFLNEWSQTSRLINTSRIIKLQNLQRVAEMNDFVKMMTSGNCKDKVKVQEFLTLWSDRLLHSKKHSTIAWNDVVLSRCVFINKFKSNFPSDRIMLDFLEDEETKNFLKLVNVAAKQGNYAVAKQYLSDSSNVILKENRASNIGIQWRHMYAKVHCKMANIFLKDTSANVVALFSVVGHLEKCKAIESMENLNQNLIEFDAWRCLSLCVNHLKDNELSLKLLTDEATKLAILSQCHRKQDFEAAIKEQAWKASNVVYEKAINYKSTAAHEQKLCHKALMKIASYCDELIESEEIRENKCGYVKSMISSLLKSMSMNSSKARLAFPRLLQLVRLFPETGDLFEKQSREVPCWMFLGWINQIVSLMDKPIVVHLKSIINNIARSYKHALLYPLKVSSGQFVFSSDESSLQRKEYLKRLLSYLHSPLFDKFANAVNQLTSPVNLMKEFYEEMRIHVKQSSESQIVACCKSIWDLLLDISSSQNSECLPKGPVFKEFSRKYLSFIESLLGKDGKKIVGMSLKDFEVAVLELKNKVTEQKKGESLKDYSPWLYSFQADNFTEYLEIPGQYTGESKPMIEYHVKINGFDEKVLVMKSIRQPVRLTIRGDDEKDYDFLVKAGEDLRQDQRIEQVFMLINKILQNDSVCCNRLLKLKTYQVIPITPRLGIIEWVSNTISYKEFLFNGEEMKILHGPKDPVKKFKIFCDKYGGMNNLYKKANRSETVKVFEDCVSAVPWDLLRCAFTKLASSSEAYFVLRSHFIQSHSCLCMAHYILGIGDRHLDNMLIDNGTGGVVGIDFGYAFGVATQKLKIPELFPFRLTKQMLNLLVPLKDPSPYKQSMMAVLQALRRHTKVLISTMDIFINEPLIDWQMNVKKTESSSSYRDCSSDWYSKHIINICKKKLNGVNPAFITSEELRNSPLHQKDEELLKAYVSVAEGSYEHNVRKKLLDKTNNPEKEFLSVEEQVDCLVDQATDPNLLGRAYLGWCPWV